MKSDSDEDWSVEDDLDNAFAKRRHSKIDKSGNTLLNKESSGKFLLNETSESSSESDNDLEPGENDKFSLDDNELEEYWLIIFVSN